MATKRKTRGKEINEVETKRAKRIDEDRLSTLPKDLQIPHSSRINKSSSMATKRKTCEKEIKEVETKRAKRIDEDRLGSLPKDLQIPHSSRINKPSSMATIRKACGKEITEVEKKDRLSTLPKDLQIRILSFLNAKQAIKTSMLSKRWVSLWTCNPVLKFDGFASKNLFAFDKFVDKVFGLRDQSTKLDRLICTRRGKCSANFLKNIFDYAFSHGVKELEATIIDSKNHTWPVFLKTTTSFESLTTLKLQSEISIRCPFLGPKSGPFENLKVLYLKGAIIQDSEPFSGFPALEKLTLLYSGISTEGKNVIIQARNLSDLKISGYQRFDCLTLKTPKLRFFGYRGFDFPLIKTHDDGFPVLDAMAVDFNGACDMIEKKKFDDLVCMMCSLSNAKSLTLFPPTVHILSSFRDELVKRRSPFGKLKCLNLDYRYLTTQSLIDRSLCQSSEIPSDVIAYLFQKSPGVKVNRIYLEYWKDEVKLVSQDVF